MSSATDFACGVRVARRRGGIVVCRENGPVRLPRETRLITAALQMAGDPRGIHSFGGREA